MARQNKDLLIDDDPPAREALERALLEADYGVVSARNSRDALCQLQQHSIDIAVLGLGRDAGQDWNTLERLTQYQPHLRLIAAGAGSEGFAHPLASAAEALLEKPIDLSLLFETLSALTSRPLHSGPRCLRSERRSPFTDFQADPPQLKPRVDLLNNKPTNQT